jgi:hypothetical protein
MTPLPPLPPLLHTAAAVAEALGTPGQPTPDPKPAAESQTIRGALVTLFSSLATIALFFGGGVGAEALGPAFLAAVGAGWSIWGRLRSSQPVSGLF